MCEYIAQLMALQMVKGLGPAKIKKIIEDDFVRDNHIEIDYLVDKINTEYEKDTKVEKLERSEFERYIKRAKNILSTHEKENIEAIAIGSVEYPEKLMQLSRPPIVVFAKGDISLLKGKHHIGVIGTRNATEIGLKAANKFGSYLANKNMIVVSGLALGCDSEAHLGCLESGGKTIAVIASPLTDITPKNNTKLAEDILSTGGLIISEYHTEQKTQRAYFLERDRIQSGLCDGMILVESDVKGGSMKTVEFCSKLGRPLACYSHPEKYKSLPQTKGNQKLLNEKIAVSISKREEIDEFLIKISADVSEEQISFL